MKKTQEQLFLEVKQKLDHYRLPTVFPFEALHLLSQLLNLLDSSHTKENQGTLPIHIIDQVNDSLRFEIGKVVKENNRLHMEILSAKEEVMALRHSQDKFAIARSGTNQEMALLIQNQRLREDELFKELTQVKYKYNELMDLVHEDSEIEKQYIKRLMKHRKMEMDEPKPSPFPVVQMKKGQSATIAEAEGKLVLLQHKLSNREAQILRLQKKMEYDGLNMNKILKDFQNNRADAKLASLEQQVEYLEGENLKMKQEVDSCRKKGGSKEALREEMRKNHESIANLSKQNKQLKRTLKEKDFDVKAKWQKDNRDMEKMRVECEKLTNELVEKSKKVENLEKQVEYLSQQLKTAKEWLEKSQRQLNQKVLMIDSIKNEEEGEKIISHYEIQSLKSKVEELQTDLDMEGKVIKQLRAQISYHKQEDALKNEAIENLQKIIDELSKKTDGDGKPVSLENTLCLRKNLAETKQLLVASENQKDRIKKDLEALVVRLEQKSQECQHLNEDMRRLRTKLQEMKHNEDQFTILQRQISTLKSDLKKQQNFRYRMQQMQQESEHDKSRLRKQLQQLTEEYEGYEKKTKTQLNCLKLENNELQEANEVLELMIKEKEKKIVWIQDQVDGLSSKTKQMKHEIASIEQEKMSAIRDRNVLEKKCENLIRTIQNNDEENEENEENEEEFVENQTMKRDKEWWVEVMEAKLSAK